MEVENLSWIDVMILLIFVFSVLSGYGRGLILTLTSLVSFFFSIFVANMFYKKLASYIILNTGLDQQIKTIISSNSGNGGVIEANSWMNGTIVNNLPQGAKGYIQETLFNGSNVNASGNINDMIATIFIHIISFLLIFLLVRFGVFLLSRGLNTLSKLPVLNFFNKVGGAFIGVVQGTIINMIIISVIYTIAIFGAHQGLANSIDNSIIAQYFYIGYILY